MASFFRDTFAGQVLRQMGMKASFPYPEEMPDFEPRFAAKKPSATPSASSDSDLERQFDDTTVTNEKATDIPEPVAISAEEIKSRLESDATRADPAIVVDWYSDDDEANPRNWSSGKKLWVASLVCVYTFVIYCASAIFVPSLEIVAFRFDVSATVVSLCLAMYVLGYGVGPMIFSPLSEIAQVGRNIPYIVSFVAFLIVSIGICFADNFAALVVLRFFQGVFGSPILASGGASLGDIYDWDLAPYAFVFWIAAMYSGPALGPLLSAYAVPHHWRWPLWEILLMSVPIFILTMISLPETAPHKILLQRAQRLRALTGNQQFRAKTELHNLQLGPYIMDAMNKPLEIMIKDPCITFAGVYGSLVYATYYSFFESFPLVYQGTYRLSGGSMAQIFLCVIVGCIIGGLLYSAWLFFIFNPQNKRTPMTYEARLRPGLPAVFILPIGLFLFAWTSRRDIHWIVPTVGVTIYAATSFVVFQCLMCYIPLSYPRYVASLLAGNDFFRSTLAAGFVMFSRAMYLSLGIAKGVTVLGGLSIMGILGLVYLYYYGAALRARSRFAEG